MTPDEAAASVAARGTWTSSRSSGPGGQRRDHVETRVELTVTRDALADLPEPLADRLAARLQLDERPLRLRCGTERSRAQNTRIVEDRLRERIAAAMAPPPPPRRPTRPTRGSVLRRAEAKRRQSAVKRSRSRPGPED